jgi:hypothetical protein
MATIVNNPGSGDPQGSASGWIVAIIAIVVLVIIGYFVIRNTNPQPATTVPAQTQDQTPSQTIVNPPATINNTTVNATTTVNNSTTTTR